MSGEIREVLAGLKEVPLDRIGWLPGILLFGYGLSKALADGEISNAEWLWIGTLKVASAVCFVMSEKRRRRDRAERRRLEEERLKKELRWELERMRSLALRIRGLCDEVNLTSRESRRSVEWRSKVMPVEIRYRIIELLDELRGLGFEVEVSGLRYMAELDDVVREYLESVEVILGREGTVRAARREVQRLVKELSDGRRNELGEPVEITLGTLNPEL